MMDERCGETVNLMSVRKIAMLSLLEVFKDILPEYRVGQVDLKMQTGKLLCKLRYMHCGGKDLLYPRLCPCTRIYVSSEKSI